jgi:hypothetical protein
MIYYLYFLKDYFIVLTFYIPLLNKCTFRNQLKEK